MMIWSLHFSPNCLFLEHSGRSLHYWVKQAISLNWWNIFGNILIHSALLQKQVLKENALHKALFLFSKLKTAFQLFRQNTFDFYRFF